jgi:hypothetical protein
MFSRKATNQSAKLANKTMSSYPHSLGSKMTSSAGKLESLAADEYQHNYMPVKDGQNLFNHKSHLERHRHAN